MDRKNNKKLSIKKIVILAFALAILICAKYKFGFNIDGIEIVTSLFILFGLAFSFFEMLMLVIAFNILVLVIYGFGTWWIAYWYIWPTMVLLLNIFYRFIAFNNITFSIFAAFMGFSILIFYFINDLIFMGPAFAISEIVTAIPVNGIEALSNCVFAVIAFYPFVSIMKKLDIISNKKFLKYLGDIKLPQNIPNPNPGLVNNINLKDK